MKKIMTSFGLLLIVLGLSFSASAQFSGPSQDEGTGYTTMRDQLSAMTHTTRLRNSDYDQWEYLTNLKATFERDISTVQNNQMSVQELTNYCSSDTDSYTCRNEDLVISVDTRMNSIVRDWQNAVLIIVEIEESRSGGVSGNSRSQERSRINVLMNDIDRLNERAKVDYNLAATEFVEFQEANPLLFTNSGG